MKQVAYGFASLVVSCDDFRHSQANFDTILGCVKRCVNDLDDEDQLKKPGIAAVALLEKLEDTGRRYADVAVQVGQCS